MGRAKTVEINGRKYDATTGKPVKSSSSKTRGGSIDGFTKPKSANQMHSRTTRSTTLDRKVVSKTHHQVKAKASVNTKANHKVQPTKSHASKINSDRQLRAKSFAKSSLISKFGHAPAKKEEVVAKQTKAVIPQQHTQPPMQQQVSEYSSKESNLDKSKAPKKGRARRFTAFKLRPKARSVFATAVLVVLGLGYVTYLNIPNLSLRVAASRSGINATMPGYKPSGFAIAGPIKYSQGLVTLNFSSNSDERNFAISERSSSWDSESLLANYVEKETPNYVTFQEKGLTVYIYDGSSATWVDGGIWYTIEGESQLNSDQLLKIAASM